MVALWETIAMCLPTFAATIVRTAGSARAITFTPGSPPSGANVNGSRSHAAYSSGKRDSTSPRVSPSQRP
ncbi:MAG: hypothetical protein U0235_31530 [Polyangiaceae bacterium]